MSLTTLINPQTANVLCQIKSHNGTTWSSAYLIQVSVYRFMCKPSAVEDVTADYGQGFVVLKNSRLVAGQFMALGFASVGLDPDAPYAVGSAVATAFQYAIQVGTDSTALSDVYYGLDSALEIVGAKGAPVLKATYQTQLGCKPPEISATTFSWA